MTRQVLSEAEFEAIREYYRNEAVRERIREFCGGEDFSCEYLVGFGAHLVRQGYRRPIRRTGPDGLTGLMEEGLDIFRSVWDQKATLAIWDVEYFNLDTWSNLYQQQLEYFELMEPTYTVIENLLEEYGISSLNDSTASGYHFISSISFSSPVHRKLEEIGGPERTLLEKYKIAPLQFNQHRRPLPERDGKGYSGIGRLLEFLSHEVIRKAQPESELPITISDTARGRSRRGRDGMNLDITQYADPLYMRDIRISFSTHQKHKVYIGKVGEQNARQLPVYATVPRNKLSFQELFEIRRDLKRAAEYAASNCTIIPDASAGWERVINDYLTSPLHAFHRDFDSMEQEPPEKWPETYWKLDLNSIAPCAANAIRNASWGLVNPNSLLTLCRVLFSQGWHPKHIAGLIRSYYESNHWWNIDWQKYHAETRACFWARIFCGMIATGADSLKDFSCICQSERGYCPSPWCGFNLEELHKAILRRRPLYRQ